jgi:surfeit locus 1 family protein
VSPRLKWVVLTLTTAAALVLTLMLGRWQLGRAAEKEQLQASMKAQGAQAMLDNQALLGLATPLDAVHRRVVLKGSWLSGHTVFLDNRQMHGKPGYFVLTPLRLGPSQAVLVQRGWVARNFLDRTQLPQIATPDTEVLIEGRIALPPSKLYELGLAEPGPIRQNLDLAAYRTETGLNLMAVSVLQTSGAGDGLLRDWPVANSGVDKHYGYAFQWFGLSALIALLYVWFQIVRKFKTRPQT